MSAKPPQYIAKHKNEPLTWDTFARHRSIVPVADLMDKTIARIKYRVATSVLIRLHELGCTMRIDDGKLLVGHGDRVSDDDKRLIGMVKEELIGLIGEGCLARFESGASDLAE